MPESSACPRCQGSGWVCEAHRQVPMHHLVNGRACGGAGLPCEELGCLFRTLPTDAEVPDVEQIAHELCRTTATVLSVEEMEQILRRLVAIGVPLYMTSALVREHLRVGGLIGELVEGLEMIVRYKKDADA